MKYSLAFLVLSVFALISCESYEPYARPYGYPRLEVPAKGERGYLQFKNTICPFTFEYPKGGKVTRDLADSCWVDIRFPDYNLAWHITYRSSSSQKGRSAHFEDYRRLIYKHSKKANQIAESTIGGENGYGILFEIYGNVGTPAQVFYTDSIGQHIVMLSFYYQTAEKNDSLQPLTNYMKEEVMHFVETIRWE